MSAQDFSFSRLLETDLAGTYPRTPSAGQSVDPAIADADVEKESFALARRIADGAPLVARWHKQFIERLSVKADIPAADWNEGFACFDTEDYREGVRAFLAKDTPRFRGR